MVMTHCFRLLFLLKLVCMSVSLVRCKFAYCSYT